MKAILPRAAALLGLSLGSALGGCVHITNTYSGLPGGSQAQNVAHHVSGSDCGCPSHSAPMYSQDNYGYPYPAYYPQPYTYAPPASDRYIYVPYGYPYQGGGYYPRPGGNYSEGGSGAPAEERPVGSTPRRPDSEPSTRDPLLGERVNGGDKGGTIGINPDRNGVPSAPGAPRANPPHDEEVRPNIPVGSAPRTGVPVATTPERDTRPRTEPPVAAGDKATAPHDVMVRPATDPEPRESQPARDTKPSAGGSADVNVRPNPDRGSERTPVRITPPEPPKADASTPAQREHVSPAVGSSIPRRESGSAATTAPVNAGASAQTGTVNRAPETAAPASGTGSQPRREAPAVKDADKSGQTAAPAASAEGKRSDGTDGRGSERATSSPATATPVTAVPATSAAPATSSVRTESAPVRKGESAVRVADPVSRPAAAGGMSGFSPSVGTSAGPADTEASSGKPR